MVIGAFEKCSKWLELKNISRRLFWNVLLYFSSLVFLRLLVVIDVKVSRKSPVDELVKEDLGGNDFDLTEYLIIFMFASTITLYDYFDASHLSSTIFINLIKLFAHVLHRTSPLRKLSHFMMTRDERPFTVHSYKRLRKGQF